jgi:DNA replication and repair protein RecF
MGQPRRLSVEHLSVTNIRNLRSVTLDTGADVVVLAGRNGSGKTSLLEAIYLLCTSKSFRASRPQESITHGQAEAVVRGRLLDGSVGREQRILLREGVRSARLDDKRPATLGAYARTSPVVIFHPGELALTMGPAQGRRSFLDRVAFYTTPKGTQALDDYTRAHRARQRLLETRGIEASDIDPWEAMVARHGLELMQSRQRAAETLLGAVEQAFAQFAAPQLVLAGRYAATAPDDEESYLTMLQSSRATDVHRGSARVGPHRDDLEFTLNGQPLRQVGSQGQHRAAVLALKIAEIRAIERTCGTRPILLLDDVSSELDAERLSAFFSFLQRERGQVFLTTTRPEWVDLGAFDEGLSSRKFEVDRGVLTRV